ncbi:MAG: extracellular solute-binding protein [Thermoleophilaceae bacterium]
MHRRRIIVVLSAFATLLVAALAGVVALTSGSSSDEIVVYTARLHYGEEEAFRRFAERSGNDVRLFGGDGPALNERLSAEGADTEADVLITVDGANLQQAVREDLLQPVESGVLRDSIPERLRDPQNRWFAVTTRARTIMRSSERVPESEAPQTYEELGDARWRGRVCLRTSDSVYNSSFVADRLAKDGPEATERMLRSWMENDPTILGSDVDVLEAIAEGECDIGFTNHYYLGRILADDADFPVAPVWADQAGRGTHVNFSGFGIVKHADNVGGARELVEYLASPEAQSLFADTNSEFPANPEAELPAHIADWAGFEVDPIDVEADAGAQADAVELMNDVGWE